MSVLTAALKELIRLGVEGEALIAAMERLEAAAYDEPKYGVEDVVAIATAREDVNFLSPGARRQRRYRERLASRDVTKRNGDVTGDAAVTPEEKVSPTPPSKTQTLPPSPPKGGSSPKSDFDLAWEAFPEAGRRRSSTKKSKPQWAAASRAAGGEARLLGAVRRFSASDDAQGDAAKFVPAFDRWLRDGRWEHWLDAPSATVTTIDPWPQRVREYRRNAYWHPDWGPKPGKPGCQVPAHLLEDAA